MTYVLEVVRILPTNAAKESICINAGTRISSFSRILFSLSINIQDISFTGVNAIYNTVAEYSFFLPRNKFNFNLLPFVS